MPADTYVVAPDALSRLGDRPKKVFVIDWAITGKLEIVANTAQEAWCKALRFTQQDIAIAGELEMSDPELKGSVQ
jgi:hypothetical protein